MWETPEELPPNHPEHQQIDYDGSSAETLHKAASVPDFHWVLSNHLSRFPQHSPNIKKIQNLGCQISWDNVPCILWYPYFTLNSWLCPIIQFVALPGPCLLPSRHSHPVMPDMPSRGHWFLNLAVHRDHLGTLESHLGIRILEALQVILR